MAIDIQIYNQSKEIRHVSNVHWEDAHEWLRYTAGRLQEKNQIYTKIEIQVYTSEDMPVDSREVNTIDEAHEFLKEVLRNAEAGKYQGVYL